MSIVVHNYFPQPRRCKPARDALVLFARRKSDGKSMSVQFSDDRALQSYLRDQRGHIDVVRVEEGGQNVTSQFGDRARDNKAALLAEAKHAEETAQKAVAKGMRGAAQEWMNKAAELRALAAKATDMPRMGSGSDDPDFAAGYRMGMNGWPEGSVKSKAGALGAAGQEQMMAGYVAAKAKFSQTGRRDSKDVSFEQGLEDNEPRIVSGVKGMQNKQFSKRFPNAAAMERWLESDDVKGDVDVYQIKRA